MNNFKPDPTHAAVNKSLFEMAVSAFLKAAHLEYPFLNIPILGQIFDRLILSVADSIFNYLQKLVTFEVISLQTEHELNSYNKARDDLKAAIERGNENEIQTKQDNLKKALDGLIDWNN